MKDTSTRMAPAASGVEAHPLRASASQALGGAKLDPPPAPPSGGGIEPSAPPAPGPIRNLNAWL